MNAAAPTGPTSDEARCRLEKFGPNAMPDASVHTLHRAFEKFWAAVPWMLEAAIVLELAHRIRKAALAALRNGAYDPLLQVGSCVTAAPRIASR
jgi:hypothetical protein